MTTDVLHLHNYTVLIEQSFAEQTVVETCGFDEKLIGFAFYGSGNVSLEISYGDRKKIFSNTTGSAISFYGSEGVTFSHTISHHKPLQCISVFSSVQKLPDLPSHEREIFSRYLQQLVNPVDCFVEGPAFYMTPDMKNAVHKILENKYTGPTRTMFLKSQVTELLSHFFGLVAIPETDRIKTADQEKLLYAKEIISSNLENPPSLTELSRLTGLNSTKLKKNFRLLFGVPVFKYLQNERLNKAYHLLQTTDMDIREAAWAVGYQSLSSFSNAFMEKFGFRPSEVKFR